MFDDQSSGTENQSSSLKKIGSDRMRQPINESTLALLSFLYFAIALIKASLLLTPLARPKDSHARHARRIGAFILLTSLPYPPFMSRDVDNWKFESNLTPQGRSR